MDQTAACPHLGYAALLDSFPTGCQVPDARSRLCPAPFPLTPLTDGRFPLNSANPRASPIRRQLYFATFKRDLRCFKWASKVECFVRISPSWCLRNEYGPAQFLLLSVSLTKLCPALVYLVVSERLGFDANSTPPTSSLDISRNAMTNTATLVQSASDTYSVPPKLNSYTCLSL